MKKILLSIFAILAISVYSFAQPTTFVDWDLQNTNLAANRGITDIIAVDANIVWAAAYNGTSPTSACVDVTKTTDGGTTWVTSNIGATSISIANLSAVDGNNCWAATYYPSGSGANDGIWRTSDGGTTWTHQTSAPFSNANSFPDCVWFWTVDTGYCMGDPINGDFEIYTTTNGGTTWVLVPGANIPNPISGEFGVVGYQSVVGNTVWFGTNLGRVYKSIDRGLNWTVAVCTPLDGLYIEPFFKDQTFGLVMDKDASTTGTLAMSSDGGNTWTGRNNVGNTFTNDMAFVPGTTSTWITTGADATTPADGITYSFDDGATWNDYTETIGFQFLATAWVNDSTGWVGAFVDPTTVTGGMYKFNKVFIAPEPNFTASDTAVALGDNVTFTDESTGGITAWNWTFPAGDPATSTLKNPTVMYIASGAHNVTLKVTNQYGNKTLVKTDYIYVGYVGTTDLSKVFINIYPNPVKDIMNIESPLPMKEIQFFNIVGQMVYEQKADSKNLSITTSNLKPGVYNVKIKIEDSYINKKVVVN